MEIIIIITTLLATALLSLLIKRRSIIECFAIVTSLIVVFESLVVALKVSVSHVYSPFTFFSVDSLGAIVMLIIAFVGFFTIMYSIPYLRRETAKGIVGFTRVRQYFVLVNIFFAAMFLAITANSPIFAWIAIEATTLSTAFLISLYNKPTTIEAAWKYLMINSIGLLLGFLGTLLYFTSVNSLGGNEFVGWQVLMTNATHLDPMIASIAFVFVLIGYGTKVGLAPMHTWLPDAHSKAPVPISALLSGVLLNVALVVVLRFKIITDAAVGQHFSQILLIIFGLLSILIASLIIFTQTNYKRLFAYSSIENMGIMALGFGFGGLGIFGAILHMIYHAFMKSAMFLLAGTVFLKYSSTKIAKVQGALTALPITSVLFLIGFFAITGTPPLGIFFSKFLILSAGLTVHPILSALALLLMGILFIGFFRHTTAMVFGEKPAEIETGEEGIWLIIPPLALIGIVVVLSFYLPPFLLRLIHDAVSRY